MYLNIGVIILAYFIGSISFSYLFGRITKGIDIRNHGSGNAGATNAYRVLGKRTALSVLLLDVFKAVSAVWIAQWVSPDSIWVSILAGVAVICGHNWPIFFGFRGGKGIASTIGVMATLCFLPTLCAVLIAIGTILITRYVSLGSLLLTGSLPLLIGYMGYSKELVICSVFIALLAFYQHRGNIMKIYQGNENKLFSKKG